MPRERETLPLWGRGTAVTCSRFWRERAISMMWKDTGINAVVAVTSVIWIMAVAWLIGDALWQGLAAI